MGVAYVISRLKVSGGKRISNHVSVFTGELLAILIAMNKIYEMGINISMLRFKFSFIMPGISQV